VKVKRFYGENIPDILNQVKAEMGSNAVIIQQRKCRRGGLLGIFKSPVVEIIAAVDNEQQRYVFEKEGRLPDLLHLTPDKTISKEITELKKIIEDKMPTGLQNKIYPGQFEQIFQVLLDNDVNEDIAREIIDHALNRIDQSYWQDAPALKAGVAEIISEYFNIADQDPCAGREHIALIGPTGVGKTTTIAKLAAIASVLKEKRVALITIDTFRVGAVDQLKTYADIISVPLEVAHTPKELKNMLARHSDKDLVLIDTAGRSPYNQLQIAEMKVFLDACPDVQTCLVLSVTTNHKDLNEIISRFSKFSIDKLVFTKLDETHRYGSIINVMSGLQKDLAYVTTGQNVPDDIEIPVPANLAHMILYGGLS
jgi:flagellar biosynthesis protein FlhF